MCLLTSRGIWTHPAHSLSVTFSLRRLVYESDSDWFTSPFPAPVTIMTRLPTGSILTAIAKWILLIYFTGLHRASLSYTLVRPYLRFYSASFPPYSNTFFLPIDTSSKRMRDDKTPSRPQLSLSSSRLLSAGREVRRTTRRRVVVRGHPVRPPGWCSPLRRRQPPAAVGEGEAGRVPHPSLRAPGLPGPPARHDRSQPRKETHGKPPFLPRH